jgi:aminocarboxymuconate-semialdehyde decarboxylase
MTMRIDVHNHFFPPRFLERLNKEMPAGIEVERDALGRKILTRKGARIITFMPGHAEPEIRLRAMDQNGIDMEVLTLTIPSVDSFKPKQGLELSRMANDEMMEVVHQYPDRFTAFATVPLKVADLAVEELNRAVKELHYPGVTIGSNIDGLPLDDRRFFPFYQEAERLDVPIHIHPRIPPGIESMKEYGLAGMIGFEMDLCIAVVRLAMGGVLEAFPNLKFIVSHLGGAVPYLFQRIENCYKAFPEAKVHVKKPPREYLSKFHFDTVSFHKPALMCAYQTFGAEKLVLGSDYPHTIGDIERTVPSILEMDIPEGEKEMILGKNMQRLLKM